MHLNMKECDGITCTRIFSIEIHLKHFFFITRKDQLDPFMKFSRNEKLRKYTNLSAHDKITLNMGKFILRIVFIPFT